METELAAAQALLDRFGFGQFEVRPRARADIVEDASESENEGDTIDLLTPDGSVIDDASETVFAALRKRNSPPLSCPTISASLAALLSRPEKAEDYEALHAAVDPNELYPVKGKNDDETVGEQKQEEEQDIKQLSPRIVSSGPADPSRLPKAEDYEALHAAIHPDELYPIDGKEVDEGGKAKAEEKQQKEGGYESKETSCDAVSMIAAANEVVGSLMPVVLAAAVGNSDRAERLGDLFDQYAVNISIFTTWLEEAAVPIMHAHQYVVVGGLDGMLDRARVFARFSEQRTPDEVLDALRNSIATLVTLDREKELLIMVDGPKKHAAIEHALKGCLNELSGYT